MSFCLVLPQLPLLYQGFGNGAGFAGFTGMPGAQGHGCVVYTVTIWVD